MAILLTVAGTDRTERVAANSIKIQNILTRKRDSLTFKVRSYTGDTFTPSLGQEVIVTLDGTRVFGGIIVEREMVSQTYKTFDWAITCEDYTRLLDRRLVPDAYENQTVDEIIADIKTRYMPAGFTTVNVNCPVTTKYVRFNYVPVSRALEQLAELTGYDWYVDYNKDIHFFLPSSEPAPIDIEDGNGSHEYDSLIIRSDNSQIRNSIVVRGGEYRARSFTGEYEFLGTEAVVPLPYKFSEFAATLTGDPLSVGIDNIDDPNDFDALHNYQEKVLKFKPEDKPSVGSVLVYAGLPNVPVIVRVSSQAAIANLSSDEGGDGVVEHLIIDHSISSKEGARQRALADLEIYKTTLSDGEFMTTTAGLKAGQRIRINSTSRGIDEYYIINRVTLAQWTTGAFVYQVSLVSTKSFDMIDLLTRLLLAETKKIQIAQDETVDILHNFSEEVALTDAVASTTSSEGPYLYDTALWGFSTWG